MLRPRPLIVSLALCAAAALHAQIGPDAIVETKVFHVPGQGERVDVIISTLGYSVALAPNAHGFQQARVEAVTLIERNNAIADYRKTVVNGPEGTDSVSADFVHLESFLLQPGDHGLVVELRDLVRGDTTPTRLQLPLPVGARSAGLSFSDVLLASQIAKAEGSPTARSGYEVLPFTSTYYPAEVKSLAFYAEVYGAPAGLKGDSLYMLTYHLEGFEDHEVFGAFKKVQRMRAAEVSPVLAQWDISGLPSGNFLLVLEARDRNGELLARQEQLIQRNNPLKYDLTNDTPLGHTFVDGFSSADTLADALRSMRPIASSLERKIIDDRYKDKDMELMKRFMYSFWYNRNGPQAEDAWKRYHAEVVKVNKLYGCRNIAGYDTDRGYVHLKYGAPNTIMDRANETDAYPYQIWHYYRAGKYTNRRFVFYMPELVGDCYELIHSEVPGEVQNSRWNQIIHSRNNSMNNVDPQKVNTLSGERALEFYNDPR
jgi:GWxTD domain-containing protein